MTARWVVDEVKDERDIDVTWQPISLLLKNEPPEGSPYYAGVLATYKMLRVMESVRTSEGNDGVFTLYWELGTRIHHDGERDFDIVDALESAGLPTSHAAAFEDQSFDAEIRRRHDAGLELVGNDVGTPIIAMDKADGSRQGIFGPVITRGPSKDDSLKLWDGMVAIMSVDGFWELKRTRTERPEFGERPS